MNLASVFLILTKRRFEGLRIGCCFPFNIASQPLYLAAYVFAESGSFGRPVLRHCDTAVGVTAGL